MQHAPLQLSLLRDIGWSTWDPIGLLANGEAWEHQRFADEYDGYLLEVAGGLRRGWRTEEAVEYLMSVERDHMGLVTNGASRSRAKSTANAIQAYLEALDAK